MDNTNNQQSTPPTFKSAESLCEGFRPSALAVCGNELRALHKQQSSKILCENGETRETKDVETANLTGYKVDPNFVHTRTGAHTLVINQKSAEGMVGYRLESHGAGLLSLAGGHLEMGESHEETSEREILEETGIKIRDAGAFGSTYDNFANHSKGVRCYDTSQRLAFPMDPDAQPETCEINKSTGYRFKHLNVPLAVKLYAESALFPCFSNLLDLIDGPRGVQKIVEHCGRPTDDLIKGDGTLEDQHKIVSALEQHFHETQEILKERQQKFSEAHWKPLQWTLSIIDRGLKQAEEDLVAMQEGKEVTPRTKVETEATEEIEEC